VTDARVSQGALEVGLDEDASPAAEISQAAVETALDEDVSPAARLSQGALEVVIASTNDQLLVSQLVGEVAVSQTPVAALTQQVVEYANAAAYALDLTQLVTETLWHWTPTPPGLVPGSETTFAANTDTTVPTATFHVEQDDLVVAYAFQQVWVSGEALTAPTADAHVGDFTLVAQVAVSTYCDAGVWSATATESGEVVLTFNRAAPAGSRYWGGKALVFREHDGVGATATVTNASGAPLLDITTTANHSTLVVINGDAAAVDGATRYWRWANPPAEEQTYQRSAGNATFYGAVYQDVQAAGTYSVGIFEPAAQQYAAVAVEVRGKKKKLPSPVVYVRRRRAS
jgi:hypothetical protein